MNKFYKIVGLVLSAVLLIGAVIGISISAADENTPEIIAQNIVYGEKISVAYAVKADVSDAISGNVGVSYYWSDETAENAKKAILLDTTVSSNLYDGKYPVFVTEGVPAKNLDKVAFASVRIGDAAPEEYAHSYSAVQYLYTRLYKNGFANKTEADGLDFQRRGLYESLIEYGSFAQSVLLNGKTESTEDDVVLVRDYSYAYTLTDGVTLNGKTAVLGADTIEVNAVYTGEGTLAGWILTDKDGVETEVETSTFTVSGVALIAPKFGVHTCDDADGDHLCDTCFETVSECKNENGDHLCDICAKLLSSCADATADGKCDVCSAYTFTVDKFNAVAGAVTIRNAAYNGSGNTAEANFSISDYVSLNSSRPTGFAKGGWFNIKANPTNSEDRVLQLNGVNNDWFGSTYNSYISFTPETLVEGGDLIVLEYDFYQNSGATGKNSFYYYNAYADGTVKQDINAVTTKSTAVDTNGDGTADANGVRLVADAEGKYYFAYASWARVRMVYDNTSKKIYTFISFDKGVSYIQCSNVTDYASAESTISSVGFAPKPGFATTMSFDNIRCYKTNAETSGIVIK